MELDIATIKHLYWDENKSISKIAKMLNCGSTTIWEMMDKNGIKRRTLKESCSLRFQWDYHSAPKSSLGHVLGVCYGDGTVCKYYDNSHKSWRYVISLQTTNKTFALEFKKSLKEISLKPSFFFYAPRRTWNVVKESKFFYEWFHSLTMEKLKKFLKDDELAKEFVRGFYESDGYLWAGKRTKTVKRKNKTSTYHWIEQRLTIVNTNPELLLLIKDVLSQMGIKPGMIKYPQRGWGKKPCYRLYICSKKKISRFLDIVKPSIRRTTKSVQED